MNAEGKNTSKGRRAKRAEAPAAGTRRSLVEGQILDAATELFAARGYAGTSLQDIARETGLTRPALYHYFPSKEALLLRLVKEVAVGPASELRQTRMREDLSVADRLREMAASVARLQARHPERFRLLIRSEADLPDEISEAYDTARRDVLREFTALISEGIGTGELRAVDPRVAALGIIGLCNWVAWWHKPGDDEADRRVVTELAGMAVATVLAGDPREASGTGVARVVELLKQDVTALETLLSAQRD
ncbi:MULTISPECIES: TetR/AcrR family transcriptional regulator [Actinomadura]|uniref:DNA-binding transcriptional regulator, AcrR family n=1 Tax=Actinomadura madurae TaxID=1993 RepID=A0A1I5GIW6_9ACTN|nr:TetR/AcrR family transcriptional regulator [Actinomadura madurae]SFO35928.1 DNA-binding transcriptional regulator, AcrR family [Actinomadura madurae]SPT51345.1 Fatty acid metabolism regulator protein [Actinomadura madurae]